MVGSWHSQARAAPQLTSLAGEPDQAGPTRSLPYVIPYALRMRTPSLGGRGYLSSSGPLVGMVRPRRKVRFARLIQRPGRVLGVPSARAAFGGNLKPTLVATGGDSVRLP